MYVIPVTQNLDPSPSEAGYHTANPEVADKAACMSS